MTDNELIAEFHGWKHSPTLKGIGEGLWNFPAWGKAAYSSRSFHYHDSWDWLMPVVKRCFDTPFNGRFEKWRALNKVICDGLATVEIDIVHKSVVEFIKWYNENKPA